MTNAYWLVLWCINLMSKNKIAIFFVKKKFSRIKKYFIKTNAYLLVLWCINLISENKKCGFEWAIILPPLAQSLTCIDDYPNTLYSRGGENCFS